MAGAPLFSLVLVMAAASAGAAETTSTRAQLVTLPPSALQAFFGEREVIVIDSERGEALEWSEFYEGAGREDLAEEYRWRSLALGAAWAGVGTGLVALVAVDVWIAAHLILLSVGVLGSSSPAETTYRWAGVGGAAIVAALSIAVAVASFCVLRAVDAQPADEEEVKGLLAAWRPDEE